VTMDAAKFQELTKEAVAAFNSNREYEFTSLVKSTIKRIGEQQAVIAQAQRNIQELKDDLKAFKL
jgi:hypothetical protein